MSLIPITVFGASGLILLLEKILTLVSLSQALAVTTTDTPTAMVSSQENEKSEESSVLRQGTFSYFLIKALKSEADRNRDNLIAIGELYDYVNRQVKSYTKGSQHPSIFGNYNPEIAVGKVESCDVQAGTDEALQHFWGIRGRSDGGNDLSFVRGESHEFWGSL